MVDAATQNEVLWEQVVALRAQLKGAEGEKASLLSLTERLNSENETLLEEHRVTRAYIDTLEKAATEVEPLVSLIREHVPLASGVALLTGDFTGTLVKWNDLEVFYEASVAPKAKSAELEYADSGPTALRTEATAADSGTFNHNGFCECGACTESPDALLA